MDCLGFRISTHAFLLLFCLFFLVLLCAFGLVSHPKHRPRASLLCNIRVWMNAYTFRSTLGATSFWPLFNYTFPLCKCRATQEWLNRRSLLDFTSLVCVSQFGAVFFPPRIAFATYWIYFFLVHISYIVNFFLFLALCSELMLHFFHHRFNQSRWNVWRKMFESKK